MIHCFYTTRAALQTSRSGFSMSSTAPVPDKSPNYARGSSCERKDSSLPQPSGSSCKDRRNVMQVPHSTAAFQFSYLKRDKVLEKVERNCCGANCGDVCVHVLEEDLNPLFTNFTEALHKQQAQPPPTPSHPLLRDYGAVGMECITGWWNTPLCVLFCSPCGEVYLPHSQWENPPCWLHLHQRSQRDYSECPSLPLIVSIRTC